MARLGNNGGEWRERHERLDGLKDLSSILQGNSLVLHRSRVAGPQPNPVSRQNSVFGATQVQRERISLGHTHMWGKLCFGLVCSIYDPVYGPENCCLYIVDLDRDDSDEWSFKAPTIRFNTERFDFEAFCVLGDSLYIFEYYRPYAEYKGGRRVWKYQLPLSPVVVNRRLEERDLEEVSPMNCPKLGPYATSTPDGKILVFSTLFSGPKRKSNNIVDLELYDPHEQLWEQLPGLRFDNLGFANVTIYGSAFLNNEPVLVLSTSFGIFSLDIRPSEDNKEWKRWSGQLNVRPENFARRAVLFRDDFCLNSSAAFELFGENRRYFEYPQLRWFDYKFGRGVSSVALLSIMAERNGCFFCAMKTKIKIEEDTMIPHLVVNVYRFDYNKFKKHLKKGKIEGRLLPGTKVLKSFKFRLTPQQADNLSLFCFGSMQQLM